MWDSGVCAAHNFQVLQRLNSVVFDDKDEVFDALKIVTFERPFVSSM